MKKDFFRELYSNKRRIKWVVVIIAVLIGIVLGVRVIFAIMVSSNDDKVDNAISNIKYTEDKAAKELSKLKEIEKTEPLSVSAQGKLYKAMTELSYMVEDDMAYNYYIAHALFYLQEAEDIRSAVFLSNKYIGRLYANGCYSAAESVLTRMGENYDMSQFSYGMQAEYYFSCADVDQMIGEDSSKDLATGMKAAEQMKDSSKKKLIIAKGDLLSARKLIQEGDFEGAEKLVGKYSEDEDFGLGKRQVYVVVDFRVPYYEINAKINLHKENFDAADENSDKYIEACNYYDFRMMKLNLVRYMADNYPGGNDVTNNPYKKLENATLNNTVNDMSDKYGQLLIDDINNTTQELQDYEASQKRWLNLFTFGIIAVCIVVILFFSLWIIIDIMGKDGLTRLYNRKAYNKSIEECRKRKMPYCILMLDIDDFKVVNDTYGHAAGDMVLSSISSIMLGYCGRGITAYRYGGEELCMIFREVPEERVRIIGEEIRAKVEERVTAEGKKVTVSGGIGVSTNGENAFYQADEKLYESKSMGKNQVR